MRQYKRVREVTEPDGLNRTETVMQRRKVYRRKLTLAIFEESYGNLLLYKHPDQVQTIRHCRMFGLKWDICITFTAKGSKDRCGEAGGKSVRAKGVR